MRGSPRGRTNGRLQAWELLNLALKTEIQKQ